jgi:tRNA dimethylallyltransferase
LKKTLDIVSALLQSFLEKHPNGALAVVGPTASGKTAFSIQIARDFLKQKAEIINADSRQIYSEIPLITACPMPEEMGTIPHHLFSFLCPKESITVAEWKQMAEIKTEEILRRKNHPLFCGGTGLYLNAISQSFSLGIPPNSQFRNTLEQYTNEELWEMLSKKDPQESKKIPFQNRRFVIRALEICHATGKPKSSIAKREMGKIPFFFIGITFPRKILYERISARTELMFAKGFLEEIKNLLKKYAPEDFSHGAFIAHGIPEAVLYLKGKISLETLKEKMNQNTRNYAKRQLTWWRRDERILWIHGETGEKIDIQSKEF